MFAMNELDPEHRPVARPVTGGQAPPPLGSDPGGCGAEHGVRGGTGAAGTHSRDTRPDRATRFIETTRGILSYGELAPLRKIAPLISPRWNALTKMTSVP